MNFWLTENIRHDQVESSCLFYEDSVSRVVDVVVLLGAFQYFEGIGTSGIQVNTCITSRFDNKTDQSAGNITTAIFRAHAGMGDGPKWVVSGIVDFTGNLTSFVFG